MRRRSFFPPDRSQGVYGDLERAEAQGGRESGLRCCDRGPSVEGIVSNLYLDTSALVKLYVEEEQGPDLVREAVRMAQRVAYLHGSIRRSSGCPRAQREGKRTRPRAASSGRRSHRCAMARVTFGSPSPMCRLPGRRDGRAVCSARLRRDPPGKRREARARSSDVRFLAFDDRLVEAARKLRCRSSRERRHRPDVAAEKASPIIYNLRASSIANTREEVAAWLTILSARVRHYPPARDVELLA